MVYHAVHHRETRRCDVPCYPPKRDTRPKGVRDLWNATIVLLLNQGFQLRFLETKNKVDVKRTSQTWFLWLLFLLCSFEKCFQFLTVVQRLKHIKNENFSLSFKLIAKKASKFRDWLDCGSMEIKPNVIAMEILAYLAYETVAQVRVWTVNPATPADLSSLGPWPVLYLLL